MLIINATIYPMNGKPIEQGYVRAEGRKIAEVGPMDACPAVSGEVFDARGHFVTPGLIDAHCHLGMWEDSLTFEGEDGNEKSDPITPQLRAIDAVNPQDRGFADAVKAGITTVVTGPGSANPAGGQMAALKTWGRMTDDMILKAPAAYKFALGENPKRAYHNKGKAPMTRMATAALIREALLAARDYRRRCESGKQPDFHFKWDSLLPVLDGACPAHIHAHRADDIATALRIAREFSLEIALVHATDGALLADALTNIPVIAGPILCDRGKPELKSLSVETPGKLARAGVSVALCTDFPVIPIEHLPLCAGLAVKAGMPFEDALSGITATAARNAGLANRVGSLAPGLDADITVWSAPPLSFEAVASAVFIDGVRRA